MNKCTPAQKAIITNTIEEYMLENMEGSIEDVSNAVAVAMKIEPTEFNLNDYIIVGDTKILDTLENMGVEGVDRLLAEASSQLAPKTNVVDSFSSYAIDDMFYGMSAAELYFDNYVNRLMFKSYLLGDPEINEYVTTNEQLSKNMQNLKNTLFLEIQQFLIDARALKGITQATNLINENYGVENYDYYKRVMKAASDYFFSGEYIKNTTSSYTGKKIPLIVGNITIDDSVYRMYSNVVLLTNFDTVLNNKYGKLMSININEFNNIGANLEHDKYKLKVTSESMAYFSNETHSEEGVENLDLKLATLIIESIPKVTNSGKSTPFYMTKNDFYLLAAIIADFELKHGIQLKRDKREGYDFLSSNSGTQLDWYLKNITKSLKENSDNDIINSHFKPYRSLIYSIEKFIYNPASNINLKEENAAVSIKQILGQVLNNSFGATYHVYNKGASLDIQQVYSQDFQRTGLQNTAYSNMRAKTTQKSFYDVTSKKEAKAFAKLFSGISDKASMEDLILTNGSFSAELSKYIENKTGIKLTREMLFNSMQSLVGFGKVDAVNVKEYKQFLDAMMKDFNTDFKSIISYRDKSIKNANTRSTDNERATKQDATVGKTIPSVVGNRLFISIMEGYISDSTISSLSNIRTKSGEAIPAFKLANMTYKDIELYAGQLEYQKNPLNTYRSAFLDRHNKKGVILGTSTRLEIVNNKNNKSAGNMVVMESLFADLHYDFLGQIVPDKNGNNAFSIVIGNYSDKSTILLKTIDGKWGDSNGVYLKQTMSQLLDKVKTQGESYYRDVLVNIYKDYMDLFEAAGIETGPFDYGNSQSYSDFISMAEYINSVLSTVDIKDLIRMANKPSIKIMEEQHYSYYKNAEGDTVTSLNHVLLDNFKIFSDPELFAEFVEHQEQGFLSKYDDYNPVKSKNDTSFLKRVTTAQLNALGMKPEDNRDRRVSIEGKLNPILQKWMWINALARNEYLFMSTKGEYMHPHKNGSIFRSPSDAEVDWANYAKDVSGRLYNMSKRNVANTATYEAPIRGNNSGIDLQINLASIEDFQSKLHSITGDKFYKQDAHDGSSKMSYIYSKMLDASFPGKGYEGTKKQFGTIVTEHGVVIKKDAETVITNKEMLNSTSSEISLYKMQKKMLNITLEDLKLDYTKEFSGQYFFNENGVIKQIRKVVIRHSPELGNTVKLEVSKKMPNGYWANDDSYNTPTSFNNLFKLWELFGAQYSVDSEGEFNEGSNDLLYEVVVGTESTREEFGVEIKSRGELKKRLIHILANQTALKAGATNLNRRETYTNDEALMYATFNSRFMGPQLDASKVTDDSEIKEITQIISALAEGGFTSEKANEVYGDIKSIIKESSKTYLSHLDALNTSNTLESRENFISYLTGKFAETVYRTKGNNIAKSLIVGLEQDGIKIPLSDQNFYNAFVKDVVTRMNTDFISRNYPGLGAVLVPSQGIIQVYDKVLPNGKVIQVTQADIAKEALTEEWSERYKESFGHEPINNTELVNFFIYTMYPDTETTLDDIEIGDRVAIGDTEVLLETPEDYYNFKSVYGLEGIDLTTLRKINSRPRDLKPTLHTFTQNGVKKNIFDFQSVKYRYYLDNLVNLDFVEKMSSEDVGTLNNILSYVGNTYFEEPGWSIYTINNERRKEASRFLNNWTQRNLSLMDINLTTFEIDENTDLNSLFEGDDFNTDVLEDVKHIYKNNIIENVKFRPAEIILGDIFQSKFGRSDKDTVYNILSQGSDFFKTNLVKDFALDETDADIKVTTSNLDTPVYIKYVETLPNRDPKINIVEKNEGNKSNPKYYRVNDKGETVYELPNYLTNVVVRKVNDADVIYVKWSESAKRGTRTEHPNFSSNLDKIIKSFGNNVGSIIPLLRENSVVKTGENNKDSIDLNRITYRKFSRFMGVDYELEDFSKAGFSNHIGNIIDLISDKKFASWEKSLDIVAARIPAQSMQSFMPMRNIAYNTGAKNDAYVSLSQIWLQGSDFDIDKAYILGYSFNNRGQYNHWSKLSNYSTKSQIDALDALPRPTGNTVDYVSGENSDPFIMEQYKSIVSTFGDSNMSNLNEVTIGKLNTLIRYINKNDIGILNVSDTEYESFSYQDLVDLINRHNTLSHGRGFEDSLKNKVVSGIHSIISAPSNQMQANNPIAIQELRNSADRVEKRKKDFFEEGLREKILSASDLNLLSNAELLKRAKKAGIVTDSLTTEELIEALVNNEYENALANEALKEVNSYVNPYDMMSYYIMQQNASVGKEDVGIAANGVKAFFALTDYYNTFYKETDFSTVIEEQLNKLNKSPELFKKSFVFTLDGAEPIVFSANTIADIQLNRAGRDYIRNTTGNFEYTQNYSNAASILSGLLSAATDNAKELLMARINATPSFASMHIYLAIMGLDMDSIIEIMTSDVANDVIKMSDHNLFTQEYATGVEKIFTEVRKANKGNMKYLNNLAVFQDIYNSSKELSSLAGLLGINQKRKANTHEIYKYLSRLENTFDTANQAMLGESKLDKEGDGSSLTAKTIDRITKRIAKSTNSLITDTNYISKTVLEASNVTVHTLDFNGDEVTKQVNLITEGLDFNLYIDPRNDAYKEAVIKYYDLIKHTFNVFDIINKVPHFSQMIESLVLTHRALKAGSYKYNVLYSMVKDVINRGQSWKKDFNKKYVGEREILRGQNYVDTKINEAWIDTLKDKVNFNLKNLMELAGEDTFDLYLSIKAKDNQISLGNNPTIQRVSINDDSNPVISLNTAHGKANFKKAMETLILPIIKNNVSNDLVNSFKLETLSNMFGIRGNSIVSSYSLQDLRHPTTAARFDQLVSQFNDLDNENSIKNLFKNNAGIPLKPRDLFYLYNIITNNGKYGNKRLTPLMEVYINEKNSLGYDLQKFSSKVNTGEIDIFARDKETYGNEWQKSVENNIFFHLAHDDGRLEMNKDGDKFTLSIKNSDFSMVGDVAVTESIETTFKNIDDIIRLINEQGLIVNLECN